MLTCKKCNNTFAFETRNIKGVEQPVKNCGDCRAKRLAIVTKYRGTDGGKASVRRANSWDNPKAKACVQEYKDSTKGKVATKRANQSDKGRSSQKKYSDSLKGIAKRKRRYDSDAGKAARQRSNVVKAVRTKEDPAFALKNNIHSAASQLLSGWIKKSGRIASHTAFPNGRAFVKHMVSTLPAGMSIADYGILWEIEHGIPQEAYDFGDPDDVKRCWSKANVSAATPAYNNKKGFKLIDSVCIAVGTENFPTKWGGQIPTDPQKELFYKKCLSAYV